MAEFVGKNLFVSFGGTTITGSHRAFTATEEMAIVDASAGSDTARTYVTTRTDGTATLEVLAQDDSTTVFAAVAPGTNGSLIWGERGNTSTYPKHTVNAIVTSRKKDSPYDDLVVITVEFQFSGAVTDSTF